MLSASSAPLYRLELAPSDSIGVTSIRSFALSITCSFITCIHHWLLHVSSKLIMINYWYSVLLHHRNYRKKDCMRDNGVKLMCEAKCMLCLPSADLARQALSSCKQKIHKSQIQRKLKCLLAVGCIHKLLELQLAETEMDRKLLSFVINRRNVRVLTGWNEPSWKWAESVHYT